MTHDTHEPFRPHPDALRRPSTGRLIGEAIRQASDLFTTEMTLVRLEATEKLTLVLASLVSLAVAAVFAIVAMIFLLQGLIEVLVHAGLPLFGACFLVGGVLLLIAFIAMAVAARNLSAARLKPARTLGQIQVAKNIARGTVR
jgi:hypothetical protein